MVRIDVMEQRLDTMLRAINIVQPALQKFYGRRCRIRCEAREEARQRVLRPDRIPPSGALTKRAGPPPGPALLKPL